MKGYEKFKKCWNLLDSNKKGCCQIRGIEEDYTHALYKLLIPLILEDWVLGYYSMKF